MTRQDLEQLCQPQTPEEVLEELESQYNEAGGDDNPLALMLEMVALKAATEIVREAIDEAANADLAPSVKATRLIW